MILQKSIDMNTFSRIVSLVLGLVVFSTVNGQNSPGMKSLTAGQIIEKIIKNTNAATIPNTVDVIKEGDPETVVTGIVTSMFATMEILEQAAAMKCNLLIVHEPLYYNHLDDTQHLKNDPVYLEKKRFIEENKLVVWRFHDYIHSMWPDGIESGMVVKLGWKAYTLPGSTNQFVIPETDLGSLLAYLKEIFPAAAFYVIGKPEMKLSRVVLSAGAPGSEAHFAILRNNDVDVVLAGEVPQWETYEYMRDAVAQNRKKAIIFLGHVNSEEAGMMYCADWLRGFIGNIPVKFVESGPAYWSY